MFIILTGIEEGFSEEKLKCVRVEANPWQEVCVHVPAD